jgi:DNA-directed RNA polymerase specialized sigma24 family protein
MPLDQERGTSTTVSGAPEAPALKLRAADATEKQDEMDLVRIVTAVQTLPQTTQQVFTLRKVHQMGHSDIGAHLGISEQEVQHHLIRAARVCARALFDPSEQWGSAQSFPDTDELPSTNAQVGA